MYPTQFEDEIRDHEHSFRKTNAFQVVFLKCVRIASQLNVSQGTSACCFPISHPKYGKMFLNKLPLYKPKQNVQSATKIAKFEAQNMEQQHLYSELY